MTDLPTAPAASPSPELVPAILKRWHAGEPQVALEDEHGLPRGWISRTAARLGMLKRQCPDALYRDKHGTLRRSGDRKPNAPRARRVFPPETWAAIRQGYEQRVPTCRLAETYGPAVTTIDAHVRREGWTRAPAETRPWSEIAAAETDEPPAPLPPDPAVLHPHQRPPLDVPWSTWVLLAGRGAGKTFAGAAWIADLADARRDLRIALVGPTLHDVREVMIEGRSGLISLPRYGDGGRRAPVYEPSRRRLVWPSGARAFAFSAEDPDSLRGPQFHAAWADELCAWRRPAHTLALLRMGLRLGDAPRLAVTTTPRPLTALRNLLAEPGCAHVRAASRANARHLSPEFLPRLEALYGGTRLYEQELEGRIVEAHCAALWTAEGLAARRGPAPAEAFQRVVVAVDPPAGTGGSACGVIVAARLGRTAYVLADRSASGLSPLGWARRVAEAAAEFSAAEVVAEANQGGDMVRSVLASAGVACPVRLVRATQGKRVRAEPVAALYEQGRVVHCGTFPLLEEELMALGAEADETAADVGADRADALVWAITALLLEPRPSLGPRIRTL